MLRLSYTTSTGKIQQLLLCDTTTTPISIIEHTYRSCPEWASSALSSAGNHTGEVLNVANTTIAY